MVLRLFIWRIMSSPLVMFLGVKANVVRVHPLQRRQVGHLRVDSNTGSSAAFPRSGDRSDTCVLRNTSSVSCIPCSGDRSDTCVPRNIRYVSGIPCSGDRSDTCV